MKISKILRFLPPILMMIVIFSFSATPAEESTELSDGLSFRIVECVAMLPGISWSDEELLQKAQWLHVPLRKTAHFSEYALLAILWLISLNTTKDSAKKRWLTVFLICAAYAGIDEWHQRFVPGRNGNLVDVCIDSAGAMAGILLYCVTSKKIMRLFAKNKT